MVGEKKREKEMTYGDIQILKPIGSGFPCRKCGSPAARRSRKGDYYCTYHIGFILSRYSFSFRVEEVTEEEWEAKQLWDMELLEMIYGPEEVAK